MGFIAMHTGKRIVGVSNRGHIRYYKLPGYRKDRLFRIYDRVSTKTKIGCVFTVYRDICDYIGIAEDGLKVYSIPELRDLAKDYSEV